jgi:hypothetical protein
MSVNIAVDISGSTGSFARIFTSNPLTFADIFDGAPQFYPGSNVLVQEILTVKTLIVDDLLVDSDLRWFNVRRLRGTYQVGNILISSPICDEDDGRLYYDNQEIRRYSSYTITANPDVLIGQHEQIALDSCNFYLVPEVYLFPGNPSPVPGSKLYDLNPALLGSTTITRAPLADTEFNQKMAGVGLYLYPGVEGISLNYKVAVINDIYTDYNPAPVPACEFLTPNCDNEFNAFLAIPANNAFDNQATCEAALGQVCCPAQFVCTSGATRVYYSFCSS